MGVDTYGILIVGDLFRVQPQKTPTLNEGSKRVCIVLLHKHWSDRDYFKIALLTPLTKPLTTPLLFLLLPLELTDGVLISY